MTLLSVVVEIHRRPRDPGVDRGSNLDALVNQSVNLTDRGLQRHRITYVREMDEQELRRVGEEGPTIDRIEIAEFESQEELREC